MALVGNTLYIANTDAVVKVPYQRGRDRQFASAPQKVADLPGGPRNHHWTKRLIASPDGAQALCRHRLEQQRRRDTAWTKEEGRAAIWEIDLATGGTAIFATGLRNPVGMAWEPDTGALWVAVNERDELGNDLVPDYMTSVRDGGFYGWPYSYYGQHVDERVKPPRPDLVAKAIVPDYALGSHTLARPRALDVEPAARAVAGGHVRRPARVVEPQAARRLQGDLRAVQRAASRRARRSTC